jgi:hypothetical protein
MSSMIQSEGAVSRIVFEDEIICSCFGREIVLQK